MTGDPLSTVFGALADPTRRAILARLAEGPPKSRSWERRRRVAAGHLAPPEGPRARRAHSRERRATARLSHLEAEPLRQATDGWPGTARSGTRATSASTRCSRGLQATPRRLRDPPGPARRREGEPDGTTRITAEPGLPRIDIERELDAPRDPLHRVHVDPELIVAGSRPSPDHPRRGSAPSRPRSRLPGPAHRQRPRCHQGDRHARTRHPVRPLKPFLWFADQAEEAAHFSSRSSPVRIVGVGRYGDAGQEITGGVPGSVMTVDFEIAGQPFVALNGGPSFAFTEAISFQVHCRSQDEVDYYWDTLSAGGDEQAQQCGWLKDRYGLSWQVVPDALYRLLADPDPGRAQRATVAMLAMKKLDIAELERAAAG